MTTSPRSGNSDAGMMAVEWVCLLAVLGLFVGVISILMPARPTNLYNRPRASRLGPER